MRIRGYISGLPIVIKKQSEQEVYSIYMTDAVKAISNNTANYIIPGVEPIEYGTKLEMRYLDVISGKQPEPEESAEDIINRIGSKLMNEV